MCFGRGCIEDRSCKCCCNRNAGRSEYRTYSRPSRLASSFPTPRPKSTLAQFAQISVNILRGFLYPSAFRLRHQCTILNDVDIPLAPHSHCLHSFSLPLSSKWVSYCLARRYHLEQYILHIVHTYKQTVYRPVLFSEDLYVACSDPSIPPTSYPGLLSDHALK